MTDRTQTVAVTFDREDEAVYAVAVLERFSIPARVEGPFPVVHWGGGEPDGLEWKVAAEIPTATWLANVVGPGPMVDRDEANDYVDSHWDREAEDREYRLGRGRRDLY